MAKKIEIDVERRDGERFFLVVDGERVLASDKLGEVMDRIEREILHTFNIKPKGKIAGLFGK